MAGRISKQQKLVRIVLSVWDDNKASESNYRHSYITKYELINKKYILIQN